MTLLALSTVSWFVLAACVVILVGTIAGLYTRKGTGIEVHPRGRRRGGPAAPGSWGGESVSGKDEREVPDPQHGAR